MPYNSESRDLWLYELRDRERPPIEGMLVSKVPMLGIMR